MHSVVQRLDLSKVATKGEIEESNSSLYEKLLMSDGGQIRTS